MLIICLSYDIYLSVVSALRLFPLQFPNPRSIGRSDHPCNGLTRWRKYAFSRKDGDLWWNRQYFSTSYRAGDAYVTIKLNGHTRTVVDPGTLVFDSNSNFVFEYNKEYEMCRLPEEEAFGRVYMRLMDDEDERCTWIENPLIAFYPDSIQPPRVLNLPNISQSILGEHLDIVFIHTTNCLKFFVATCLINTTHYFPPHQNQSTKSEVPEESSSSLTVSTIQRVTH